MLWFLWAFRKILIQDPGFFSGAVALKPQRGPNKDCVTLGQRKEEEAELLKERMPSVLPGERADKG